MADNQLQKGSEDRALEVRRQFINPEVWKQIDTMAATLINSQALPNTIKNSAQLAMVFLAGYEFGMSAIESLNSFYIVNGKVTIYGQAVITQLKRQGFKVKWGKCDLESATVTIIMPDGTEASETYAMEEAIRSKLTAKGGPWLIYPKDMLKWKAVGHAVKYNCPEVLLGYYIKEEIEADGYTDPNAAVVELTPKAEEKTALPPPVEPPPATGGPVPAEAAPPAPENHEEAAPQLMPAVNKKIHAAWGELAQLCGWDAKTAADNRHATIAKHYPGKASNNDLTMSEATDFYARIVKAVEEKRAAVEGKPTPPAEPPKAPEPLPAAPAGNEAPTPCPICGITYTDEENVSNIKLGGLCVKCEKTL